MTHYHPLLATKFHAPSVRPGAVTRQALIAYLNANPQRKLTLISAPAGYGKTTLAAQWIEENAQFKGRVVWLTLDDGDNDIILFLSYLVAACQRIIPALDDLLLTLQESTDVSFLGGVLNSFINTLSHEPDPLMLILDDLHLIHNPDVHQILQQFLDYHPPQVHLVILTRETPPLSLSRLRARHQMAEIGINDLQFSRDEIERFMAESMHLSLDHSLVESLEARTEGWIAGLQLAGLALQSRPNVDQFLQGFPKSHRYIADYLAEEVFQHQPEPIQRFLIQTSLLDRFNTELCLVLTDNPQSHHLLETLEQSNLFVVALDYDHTWYRYHQLFADYLQTHLSQDDRTALYQKAATWHEAQGMVFEAVRYALASEDAETIADTIANVLTTNLIWSHGHLTLYVAWLDALSSHAYDNRPHLCLNASVVFFLLGQFDQAIMLIEQAEDAATTHPDEALLLALAELYRGLIAAVRGHTDEAIRQITHAQTVIPTEDHLAHARAYFGLGLAYEIGEQFEEAIPNYIRASDESLAADGVFLAIQTRCSAAQAQMAQGYLNRAEHTCQHAIDLAEGKRLPPLGIAWSILGAIALERNDLDRAQQLLEDGIALSQQGGLNDDVIAAMAYVLRLTVYQGKALDTLGIVEEVMAMVNSYDIDRISVLAGAHVARAQIMSGEAHKAAQWIDAYHGIRSEFQHEFAELTVVRYLLMENDIASIPDMLMPLLAKAQTKRHFRSILEIHLLLARYYQAMDDSSTAVDYLAKAVDFASTEGFIRIILDEPTLLDLLPQVRTVSPEFVDSIRPAQQNDANEQLTEPLTDQELRILSLIAEGKTNPDIAAELVITLGTAKWHVHNILQKLAVSNRSQAIIRAQELGLVDTNT